MKQILLAIALCCVALYTEAQPKFVDYKDTVHHFSIKLPQGWKTGLNRMYPSIKLVALRNTTGPTDTTRDNLNIVILDQKGLTPEEVYKEWSESLQSAKEYKLIDKGNMILGGKKFWWLLETHKNLVGNISMHNWDFMTHQNGKTYILTMVTFSNNFDNIRDTYKIIGESFRVQ